MDLIYNKYEQFTKCKPHTDPAFFVCIHPYCLGRFICPKCIHNHNPDHRRHLTPIQDFFGCAVQPRLEEEAQKEHAKETKTKKEINQILVKVDEMFVEFEKEFINKLAEIKIKVKQELSEPLKETKLGSRFWNHLKDKLLSSYADFIKKGMLDEVLLYNYISAYDKAVAKINEVSINPSLLNEEEMSQQSNVNIDYKPLELMFGSMGKILEDFSQTMSLRPSLNSSRRINIRKTSLGTGSRLSQRTFESPEDKVARTARKISEPMSTLAGGDFPKFIVVRRDSKNYPLARPDQSAFRSASAIVRRRESSPNMRRHVYTLDNLKQFDSGHDGIISAAIQIEQANQIVTGGREGKIKFWDQATFKLVRTIDAHKTKIYSLKYIEKKNLLVSASQDTLIKVFKLDIGSYKTWTLLGHRGPVTALEYASNLGNIISGGSSKDKTIKIWDLADFTVEFEFHEHNQPVFSLLYVEGMCVLFAGLGEGTVSLYDMEKKSLKFNVDTSFGEHSKSKDVVGLAVSEEQKMLYCGNLDGSVSIWDMKHYPFTATRKFANGLTWARFLFLPKKGVGVVSGRDKSIRIVDLATGETQRIFELIDEEGSAITFIEKNQVLITDLKTSSVKLWTLVKNDISP